MKILGLAGRKGSGKTTSANYLFGMAMKNIGLINKFSINDKGQLVVPMLDETQTREEDTVIDPLTPNREAQDFFAENVWPFCKIYAFADPLKAICCQILGLSPQQCYGSQEDKNTNTHLNWEDMPSVIDPRMMKEFHINSDDLIKLKLIQHDPGKMTAREVMQYVGTEIFRSMYKDVWVHATMRKISIESPQIAVISDVRFKNECEAIKNVGGKIIFFTRSPYERDKHPSETLYEMNSQKKSSIADNENLFDAVIDNKELSIDEQNQQLESIISNWAISLK